MRAHHSHSEGPVLQNLKFMPFMKYPCILELERSQLWLVMKEEKRDQERKMSKHARWNKARTCSLVWSVIYLNLLWDSRTGCVSVYVGVCTVSMYSLLIWSYCECVCMCVCEWQWNSPPLPIHQTKAVFLYEVTLGQPEYIYRGTFMNSGERALTGNYRLHGSVPPLLNYHTSINVGMQRVTDMLNL